MPDPTTADVDARTEQLMQEFAAFLRKVVDEQGVRRDPFPDTDQGRAAAMAHRRIWESWVVQKIAGLQVALEMVAGDVNRLVQHINQRK
jgi:hypothetical protein